VLLGALQYYTGQFFQIQKLQQAAAKKGCVFGLDCAHAAGNIDLRLHEWQVDFAVWCHYKYVNAGPGAIAGYFIHQKHHKRTDLNRFAGWWGHESASRFEMDKPFTPIPGAFGFRLSNPSVFSIAPLLAALEVFEEAGGMKVLRQKSILLTGFLEFLLKKQLTDKIKILTPEDPLQRGCQLSLFFTGGDAEEVEKKLNAEGVICDVRKPNVIRIAPTPLYNTFQDVFNFVAILKKILVK